MDCDEHHVSDVLCSEIDPKSELCREYLKVCFNEVLSQLPFERTIVVGEVASSPDFSKVDLHRASCPLLALDGVRLLVC